MKVTNLMFAGALLAAATALAGMRTNDYSWVRGTHYGLVGDAGQVARELGYGGVGIDNIPVFLEVTHRVTHSMGIFAHHKGTVGNLTGL